MTTQPPPANVTFGNTFSVVVKAEDAFGNVVTSYNTPVTLTLGNNPGGATLAAR